MRIKNKTRFCIATTCTMIILIFAIILVAKGISIVFTGKSNNQKEEENLALSQQNDINNEIEVSKATSSESPEILKQTKDLNHLSNTEASFGNIEVPVYKKGEKNIKIPIIIYHAFQTPVPEDDKYKLFSTEERFEENVTTLLDDGYTFITLEDLYKYNKGYIGLPKKNVIITMDDGWIGCYTEAFNVVKRHNIPITIFVVENLVGAGGYFSWEQAKEMYDTGLVKIHVHGQKHINATDYVTKEQLINAYNHAHSAIEENLGESIQKIMAYPAGKYSENTISWLKEAGFEIQVQTMYGTVNKSSNLDLTKLGRIRGEQATGKSLISAINKK